MSGETTLQVREAPLHRTIYEALREAIQSGEYRDGDRLPSEAALCEQFGASRITVAKAVHGLQRDGLVVRRPGSGSYIQVPKTTSYRFGLLIPELGSTEIFEPICRGIMQSPHAAPHALVWGHASADERRREEVAADLCRQFIAQKVSGVFFAPLEYTDGKDLANQQIVAELRRAQIPIVLLDRCYEVWPRRSNLDRVGIDNHRASYAVTQHLWDQGARRILFAARQRSATTIIERISGYHSALRECGSEFVGKVYFGDMSDNALVWKMIEAEQPDGVVCGNDLTAARFMRSLISLGVRVPEQVRLVGFDDVSYAKYLPVPLTTIHQDCNLIGDEAMALMLERIRRPEQPGVDVLVPFDLVVRESCGVRVHGPGRRLGS